MQTIQQQIEFYEERINQYLDVVKVNPKGEGCAIWIKNIEGWNNEITELKKRLAKIKFAVGDKVEVVDYGSLFWQNKKVEPRRASYKVYKEDANFVIYDMHPELIGKQGIICDVSECQGIISYAIDGIPGKHAWYHQDQLKMINKNPNTHATPDLH